MASCRQGDDVAEGVTMLLDFPYDPIKPNAISFESECHKILVSRLTTENPRIELVGIGTRLLIYNLLRDGEGISFPPSYP